MERTWAREANFTEVRHIHFTGKRPIYLIIRNLHNGQLACLVRALHVQSNSEIATFSARLETLGR